MSRPRCHEIARGLGVEIGRVGGFPTRKGTKTNSLKPSTRRAPGRAMTAGQQHRHQES